MKKLIKSIQVNPKSRDAIKQLHLNFSKAYSNPKENPNGSQTQRNVNISSELNLLKKRNLSVEVSEFFNCREKSENASNQNSNSKRKSLQRIPIRIDHSIEKFVKCNESNEPKIHYSILQYSPKVSSNTKRMNPQSSNKKESKLSKLKRKFLNSKKVLNEKDEKISKLESTNQYLLEKLMVYQNSLLSKGKENNSILKDSTNFAYIKTSDNSSDDKLKFFKKIYKSKIDSLKKEIEIKSNALIESKFQYQKLEEKYLKGKVFSDLYSQSQILCQELNSKINLLKGELLASQINNQNIIKFEKQEKENLEISEKCKENLLKCHLLFSKLFNNEIRAILARQELPLEFLLSDHLFLFKKIENSERNHELLLSLKETVNFSTSLLNNISEDIKYLKESQSKKYGEECLFGDPIFNSR